MITGSKLQEQFVPYDLAMKLKLLGFKEKCFSAYRNTDGEKSLMGLDVWENGATYDNHEGFCAAPLWQQAIDWLADKYDIDITTPPFWSMDGREYSMTMYRKSGGSIDEDDNNTFLYFPEMPTRISAIERLINEAVKIIEQGDNVGCFTGEICNRNGCRGAIDEHESESSCSCHINPPCSYCVDDRHYCPTCNWDGRDEQIEADRTRYTPEQLEKFRKDSEDYIKRNEERRKEIDMAYDGKIAFINGEQHYVVESWGSGYRAKGWKPKSMTSEELMKIFNFDLPRCSINEYGGFIISGFTD